MFTMTEEQAKHATEVLNRLYARELGLEITNLVVFKVSQEPKEIAP